MPPKRKAATSTSSRQKKSKQSAKDDFSRKAVPSRTNYVLYETFSDPQVPIEDVAQGMARAIAYDDDAIQQVLALLAKGSGLSKSPHIEISDPKLTAQVIEQLCEGAPAAFPLATTKLMRRFEELITLFYPVLHESQCDDTLLSIIPFVGALSSVKLRSLRLAATAFMAPLHDQLVNLTRCNRHVTELKTLLSEYLDKRRLDVSPEVRHLAVAALPFVAFTLNDENPEVRLAALENINPSKQVPELDRIEEIAAKDADVRCRQAAVGLLNDAPKYLKDTEPLICAVAASKFLETSNIEEYPLDCSPCGAVALARASKLSIERAVQLSLERGDITLVGGACVAHQKDAETTAVQLVTGLAEMLDRFHGHKLLSDVLRLFEHVNLDAALSRNLEKDIERVFGQACKIYAEYPNESIKSAFQLIAKCLTRHSAYSSAASSQMSDTVDQLVASRADVLTRCGQIAGLGRYVDIAEMQCEDIWSQDKPQVREYAANIAFHGDLTAITNAVEYLGSLDSSTNELLKVLIVARVRGLTLEFDTTSLSLVGVERVTVKAARAAEVLV